MRARSPVKLRVLELVEGGAMDSEDLARALGIPRPHAAKYLLTYCRQGLLARRRADTWRKKYYYNITTKGKERKNFLKKFF